MDLEDEIPILILHVLEADIAQNAGVVDEDVNTTKCLNSGFDDLVAILDRVVVCNSLASIPLNLINDNIGSLDLHTLAHAICSLQSA